MNLHATQPIQIDEGIYVEFGNNTGDAVFDGFCNDPRFRNTADDSPRMAEQVTAENMFRDAFDCRRAHHDGAIRLRTTFDDVRFGDDDDPWAFDYTCSDPRFELDPRLGSQTAQVPPKDPAASFHDATDCRRAYVAEEVWYLDEESGIAFGNDSGRWARDGQCDDPRFEGVLLPPLLLLDNVRRDATDCRRAFLLEVVRFTHVENSPDMDFGRDGGQWAYDGECDDPRFHGSGMAATTAAANAKQDATDCYRAYQTGRVEFTAVEDLDGIRFGDDSGRWVYDGECDDPRFRGPGMASGPLEKEDRGRDATDCFRAYRADTVEPRP